MISRLIILSLLLWAVPASCQTSPFNVQFLSKPTAQTDREYLGIFGSSGTNYTPGANVTFTKTGPYSYAINAPGGGGGGGTIVASGTALMAAGNVTIASPKAYTTNSIIVSYVSLDGRNATVLAKNIAPGTSFQAASSYGSDTNMVAWTIISP
jgi:hypothetical protein